MKLSLFITTLFFLLGCQANINKELPEKKLVEHNGLEAFMDKKDAPFYHGVASGDPTQNAVVIWTRYTPMYHQIYSIHWEISTDNEFVNIIRKGKFETSAERDYTVKIDVQNLEAGKEYYYRFKDDNHISPIGKTKTLPKNPEKIKLAFASCSNFAWGYFNAYRMMGDDTLDVVIHLGDYIYEHEPEVYNAHMEGRSHIPVKEIISLQDYRTRYAQYRLDKDLQYSHAKHPFITIWDDHELANNAYKNGAGNHQENEGDWQERLEAAKKAYYEWMPIRENNGQHYRSFSFGKLANLIMLDTRTEGRDIQPEMVDINNNDSTLHIINETHFDWLKEEINKDVQWKIIGSQIMFSDLKIFFSKTPQLYNDGWSAYRYDQKKMLDLMESVNGAVIISGDFHSSFAIREVKSESPHQSKQFIEYVVPSISSANYDEDYGLDSAKIYKNWYDLANENLIFSDLTDHGYFTLELTNKTSIGTYRYVDNVKTKEYQELPRQKFEFPFSFLHREPAGFINEKK